MLERYTKRGARIKTSCDNGLVVVCVCFGEEGEVNHRHEDGWQFDTGLAYKKNCVIRVSGSSIIFVGLLKMGKL